MDFSKALTLVLKQAGTYVEPVIRIIKKHPVEVTVGVVGTGFVTDDLRQIHRNRKTMEVLKKHEAGIQILKVEADKAENLEIINE